MREKCEVCMLGKISPIEAKIRPKRYFVLQVKCP